MIKVTCLPWQSYNYSKSMELEAYPDLFANWATACHGATIVSTGAGIPLGHFLSILSPLASITDLQFF